jgi:RNA polymerase sigma-70 factor (ECF subfamily)
MNEAEIIQKCQKNDLSAFKMIYDRYKQPLLHTAFRMLGQQQDAEDAVQTAFLKLYRGIQNFHRGSRFSTYLFRILLNVCFDMLKKRKFKKIQLYEKIDLSNQPKNDLKMYLEEAIAKLPERMRACFVLFAVEDIRQNEIAKILNISVGGVKSNIHHAKAKLRTILSDSLVKEKP